MVGFRCSDDVLVFSLPEGGCSLRMVYLPFVAAGTAQLYTDGFFTLRVHTVKLRSVMEPTFLLQTLDCGNEG